MQIFAQFNFTDVPCLARWVRPLDRLITFGFDPLQGEIGAVALSGDNEYINVMLFEEVDHDRKITGQGRSIMCYDPKVNMKSPPLFDEEKVEGRTVPAGHRVRVIGATVKFT